MAPSLILQSSALAQWHALVAEARQSSSIALSEDLESYLVFLLMRFTKDPNIVHNTLALEFLENVNKNRNENLQNLRNVGDKCLLFSGFFPGKTKHCRVKISYYVTLGQMAYSSISESHRYQLSSLFGKLSEHFVGLMDILHYIRELTPNNYHLDLIESTELWQEVKSEHALKKLRRATQGFIIFPPTEESQRKH